MAEVKKETPERQKVTLQSAFVGVWKKYADFNGRLSRKGYWYFILFNMIIVFGLELLDRMVFRGFRGETGAAYYYQHTPFTYIYSFAVFIPHLSAATRRLHDKNRSGWLQLLNLIPIVGQIVVFIFLLQKGDQEENDYGPVPEE